VLNIFLYSIAVYVFGLNNPELGI